MINLNNYAHYGDILAIPFFMLLSIYFYNKNRKTLLEYILFFFAISGFVLDSIFTYIYLFN
jgi:hypothetical protein